MASAFVDKGKEPGDADVAGVLGPKPKGLWDELRRRIAAAHPPLAEEWTYAGKNYGWSRRLKQKKRAVLYMIPREGSFGVGLLQLYIPNIDRAASTPQTIVVDGKPALGIFSTTRIPSEQAFQEGYRYKHPWRR